MDSRRVSCKQSKEREEISFYISKVTFFVLMMINWFKGDRFDAHDEPLRPFEAPGVRAFPRDHGHDQRAQSNALRNEGQRDFEVEYVDIPNRGCFYPDSPLRVLYMICSSRHTIVADYPFHRGFCTPNLWANFNMGLDSAVYCCCRCCALGLLSY